MNELYRWGLDVIIVIQKIRSPLFDHLFLAITALGNDIFYMLILPFLYWCVDKRHSLRLFYLFMISNWLNAVTKNILNQPRPFMLNESVKIAHATGPGIPSGHAQGSLVFWGFLAMWVKKRTFTIFSVSLIILIAFSRLYLGVHFPTDIIGGWILGLIILFPGYTILEKIERKVAQMSTSTLIFLGTFLPLALSFVVPTKYSVSPMGITAGITLATILEKKYVNFEMPSTVPQCAFRYFIGIIGLFIIYVPLKILISKGMPFPLAFTFFQYYTMGLWVGWFAPWLFSRKMMSIKLPTKSE
ncbi:MAG: phosphatase PAP2 family protein [Spirochaetes bacterium]|nr:phosphatase PAP2 family protein [Spirochaetota bacterium]